MAKKRLNVEQIIGKLREAELLLAQGQTVPQAAKKIGVTEQTYYRWRKEYGGLRTDQAKRFKELEQENARLAHARPKATNQDGAFQQIDVDKYLAHESDFGRFKRIL